MILTPDRAVIEHSTLVGERLRFPMEASADNAFVAAEAIAFTRQVDDDDQMRLEESSRDIAVGEISDVSEKTIAQARREVERYPTSARAQAHLGIALLNSRKLDEAVATLEYALKLDPSHYLTRASLVRAKILHGHLEEAEALVASLHADYPDDPGPLMSLASIAALHKDFNTSAQLWRQAIECNPRMVVPYYYLGMVFLRMGRSNEAISQLKQAVRIDPRSPTMYQGLGVAYASRGDMMRAAQAFKAALTLAPMMPEAVHGLAGVLFERKHFDQVIDLLNDYLSGAPDDHEAREWLAGAYIRRRDHLTARKELFRALVALEREGAQGDASALPRARMANNLGVCYRERGDLVEAERFYVRSIEAIRSPQDPGDARPIPYHNLARLYLDRKNKSHALAVLAECSTQFSEDGETRLLMGIALAQLERYDEAVEQLRDAIRLGYRDPAVYNELGYLLVDLQRNPVAAYEVFREGYRLFPDDPTIANNLAYAYLQAGNAAASRAVLDQWPDTKLSGITQITMTATRGLLCLAEDDLEGGAHRYRGAEKLAMRSGVGELARVIRRKMHLELARAYMRMGDLEAAEREAQKGLRVQTKSLSHYVADLTAVAEAIREDGRRRTVQEA